MCLLSKTLTRGAAGVKENETLAKPWNQNVFLLPD